MRNSSLETNSYLPTIGIPGVSKYKYMYQGLMTKAHFCFFIFNRGLGFRVVKVAGGIP